MEELSSYPPKPPDLKDIKLGSHGVWKTKELTLEDYVNCCSSPILGRIALLFNEGVLLTGFNVKSLTDKMDSPTKNKIWNIYKQSITKDNLKIQLALEPLCSDIRTRLKVEANYCDLLKKIDFTDLKQKLPLSYEEFVRENPGLKKNKQSFIRFLPEKLAFDACKEEEEDAINELVQSQLPKIPDDIQIPNDEQLKEDVKLLRGIPTHDKLSHELKDLYRMFCKEEGKISDDKEKFLDYIYGHIDQLKLEQKKRLAHTINKWKNIEETAKSYKEKLDQLDMEVLGKSKTFTNFVKDVWRSLNPEYYAMYPSFKNEVLSKISVTEDFRDSWASKIRLVQQKTRNPDDIQRILAIDYTADQVNQGRSYFLTDDQKEIIKNLYAEYLVIHEVKIDEII